MTLREAVDQLRHFVENPSTGDQNETEAYEALDVLEKLVIDAEEAPLVLKTVTDVRYQRQLDAIAVPAGGMGKLSIVLDPGMPKDQIEFRDERGAVLGTIQGLV